jgi:signal transduction histidine kinase/DNA-binding response OmpR family regulator
MRPLNPPARPGPTRGGTPGEGEYALQGLVGIAGLQHSAGLAGVAGGGLLVLLAAMAWLGTARTGLDLHWLLWAALPALLAAFAMPLLGRRLISRRNLTGWRVVLALVMTLNTSVWTFASVFAGEAGPSATILTALVWCALSLSLLPSLSWLPGLAVQLAAQLLLTLGLAHHLEHGSAALVLPLGLWSVLVLLAWTGALYARRAEQGNADLHYLRFEAAELQRRNDETASRLHEAEQRNLTLESELGEILTLAEDASRAKTEFLATMSHEIRTPLNGILPILEMLRDTPLDREQLKMVQTAQGSSRHLLRIINDILDFAKAESGKLQLEAIEIDVRDLVGSVAELMGGSARNRNLKLSSSVADNVPQVVRGDPIRLRQVLINLVSNAIKFTEEGGIRIEVSLGQTSQKEVELLFAVADTGIGMSSETADRLFQSFTQADASTTRKHGGTGLGLVICKRLVELMGGKIGVRSEPGQGSTFWFLVPLRRSVMEVPSARRNLKGVRMLTLTADPDLAARLSQYLRAWGVVEETASEPGEALNKLRSVAMLGDSWVYDLVLVDGAGMEQRLPSLLGELRSMNGLRRLPVVVALRSESLGQKLKRDYGIIVLAETLRPEPLRRTLHRLLDVESQHFGNPDLRAEEVYDDLNLSAVDLSLAEPGARPKADFAGRVLLVEDNPVNQAVVSKALSTLGLSCITANDGREAMAEFERGRFDMVFMDCQMPVMDGYEATGRIRQLERERNARPTPIVAMTANAMAGDRERCIDAGMDDYLPKPVSMDALRACVGAWIAPMAMQAAEQTAAAGQAPAPAAAVPVLDQAVLNELREIMQDDYTGLLRTYLGNAPELMQQARAAIAHGDLAALVLPVHSLKSSSANVGAMQLSALAREAEQSARGGDLAAAAATFEAVEAAFAAAVLALEQQLAAKGAAA